MGRVRVLDLLREHGDPKLGRWVHCKYCYKNVLPKMNVPEELIQCAECTSGLTPLADVIKAGGYADWEAGISREYRHSAAP